jgi:hypothetical protein
MAMTRELKSPSERRKYKRAQFKESIVVHPVIESKSGNVYEVGGDPIEVKSMDVSEGGLRLQLLTPVPPHKMLKVNFELPKNKLIDVYTKITWVNGALCGLQFIVLDENTRQFIRGYVEKNF